MTYNELIKAVASKAEFTQADTRDVLEALQSVLVGTVASGDYVAYKELGKFVPKTHAAHEGHNPRTGETIQIPEKVSVKFNPTKSFKEALNG